MDPIVQYIEVQILKRSLSLLAWICERCSPPIFAACVTQRAFRRMTLHMKQR